MFWFVTLFSHFSSHEKRDLSHHFFFSVSAFELIKFIVNETRLGLCLFMNAVLVLLALICRLET